MIELINLGKSYSTGFTALENINLTVPKGQIFGVIGPSGAGKSTLIRCINLIEKPSSGQVIVDRKDLTHLSDKQLRDARKQIGMIFQHFNLLSSSNVYDNIALPLKISGLSRKEITKTVQPLLELTGLLEKKSVYPSQLSGGQKQRVAIARALANKPKVLLSDEATSALDPQTTHSILQLLKDINDQLGLTILLITHEMNVVKEICHRLAILEDGKIIEESDVLQFFSNPKTHIAKQFIRTNLQQHLPTIIQQRLVKDPSKDTDTLLRLSFVGSAAQEPLIAYTVQNFSIEVNILQANIEVISDEIMGVMLVQIGDASGKLPQAMEYLRDKGVFVEVIGYVKRNN